MFDIVGAAVSYLCEIVLVSKKRKNTASALWVFLIASNKRLQVIATLRIKGKLIDEINLLGKPFSEKFTIFAVDVPI